MLFGVGVPPGAAHLQMLKHVFDNFMLVVSMMGRGHIIYVILRHLADNVCIGDVVLSNVSNILWSSGSRCPLRTLRHPES